METLSPNIFVKDIVATIDFYKKLGFSLIMQNPEEGEIIWAMMNFEKVSFMFQTYDSLGNDIPEIKRTDGGSLLFYIRMKNIKKYFDEVSKKVEILVGLETTFYGATEFSIVDLNGYVLTFSEMED